MRKEASGRARPPGGNWRVCRSFLRHLGKENVAKYAKVQQGLPPKAVSYTLLDQFMTESLFTGPWQSFSFADSAVESVL